MRAISVRRVGVALGLLRCSIGAVMVGDPPRLARLLGVDSVTAAQTGWLTRMIGGREIGLGVGSLGVLAQGYSGRSWYAAQALADGGDALALIAAVRAGRVSTPAGSLIAASAVAGAVVEIAVMRSADGDC
ncbi:MAG: hypothetical protein ABJC62_01010 [Frankiaceae bacterium]